MPEAQVFRYSVVVPVYNEHEVIAGFCTKAKAGLPPGYELLICYDFEGDSTLPALSAIPADQKPEHIRLVHNTLGKGVRYAIEAGMRAATAPVTLVMMADMSDDPSCVEAMISRVEAGAHVVCGSRYMKGGQQIGGPWFKKFLSRSAGVSLHYLTGLPTHDPTNSFKAYRTEYLRGATIESKAGFCLGLELTAKAYFAGGRVEEVPSTWTDRSGGESRFRLGKWLPLYLDWYAWTLDKSRRANILLPTVLFAFVLILGILQLTLQPQLYLDEQYITQETGNQLWRADRILQGKLYQRDFACQYGPLGSYLYAGAAAVFGNTPIFCHLWHYAMNLLCFILAYVLMRRAADLLTTLLFSIIFLMTLFISSSSCGVHNTEYMAIERSIMLGLALLWQPPERRGAPRSFVLGILLGVMQWTKFGGALFSLGAILLLDLVFWLKHSTFLPFMFRKKTLVGYSSLLIGFVFLEAIFAAWAFILMPQWIAVDTLWPSYMKDDYKLNWGEGAWKLSNFRSIQYFFGRLLVPFLAALMGIVGFIQYLYRPANRENDRGFFLFLNLLFFLTAIGTYIGHIYIMLQYLIGPAMAGMWYFNKQIWWFRIASLSMTVPFIAVTLLFLSIPPKRADMAWFEVAPGQRLYLMKALIRDLERMPQIRSKDPTQFLLVIEGWSSGGFDRYFNREYSLRNTFIIRFGFRPYDVAELMASKDRIHAVLVDPAETEHNLAKALSPILGEDRAREFAELFVDKPDPASGYYQHYSRK